MSKYFYLILIVFLITGWIYVYKSHLDRFNAPVKKTTLPVQKYTDITSDELKEMLKSLASAKDKNELQGFINKLDKLNSPFLISL